MTHPHRPKVGYDIHFYAAYFNQKPTNLRFFDGCLTAYATSMNTVVSTAYEIFNRKLFSLPKILLLPGVMSRQPLLVVQVFPFIIISDWVKASAVSYMTTKIEAIQKEVHDVSAIRSKVESFDIKNADLLQRSGRGATKFTQRRWEELTIKVQTRLIVADLLTRTKGFFEFMQRNFVFTVLIDCALSNLIAIAKIVPSEIFVFSRVRNKRRHKLNEIARPARFINCGMLLRVLGNRRCN